MGARKTAGLSRDSAYEGAGLAAPLLYEVMKFGNELHKQCIVQG